MELHEVRAELAMIDENLIRNELTDLERCDQQVRRKEIYEALYPEARKEAREASGARETNHKLGRGDGSRATRDPSYTEDAAQKQGLHPGTVRQEVQIGRDIAPDVKEAIRDAPIANQKTALLELAQLPCQSSGWNRSRPPAAVNSSTEADDTATHEVKTEQRRFSPGWPSG
ncbi:MAG TPA: hypothetical protein VGO93_31255 [Candidatus Xenobia bacterium]